MPGATPDHGPDPPAGVVGTSAGVGVAVGTGLGVAVGTGLGVAVGTGVGLGLGVGDAVERGVGVAVGAGVGVAVAAGVGVAVARGVGVAVGTGVGFAVGTRLGGAEGGATDANAALRHAMSGSGARARVCAAPATHAVTASAGGEPAVIACCCKQPMTLSRGMASGNPTHARNSRVAGLG
ncbi:MAG TPA: hypothetical protein VK669_14995 [Candidatus Limnocylindrales bacterium]|nr:hypothetical protein [Candidatus Limnocylindrales bacterium]